MWCILNVLFKCMWTFVWNAMDKNFKCLYYNGNCSNITWNFVTPCLLKQNKLLNIGWLKYVHIKKLDNNEVGKKESLTIHACLFDALSVNI